MFKSVRRIVDSVVTALDVLINETSMEHLKARQYWSYKLVYSKGTSLVGRIRFGKTYEPENLNKIFEEIQHRKPDNFLDIGANIGLLALPCLARFPNLKVYAFEPGEHQRALLEQTVKLNKLDGRMEVIPLALSNKAGKAAFAVHASPHASGDGLLDTGRAGVSHTMMVDTITLDEWWKSSGCPEILVVKMDVEGSEKWVLEGSREFLSSCRPSIILEIWPENEKPYGYFSEDVFDLLVSYGYTLTTAAGESLTKGNSNKFWGKEDTFIARPADRAH